MQGLTKSHGSAGTVVVVVVLLLAEKADVCQRSLHLTVLKGLICCATAGLGVFPIAIN